MSEKILEWDVKIQTTKQKQTNIQYKKYLDT